MGKSKKMSKLCGRAVRPQPLLEQLNKDDIVSPTGRIKVRKTRKDEDDKYVGGQLGNVILKQSITQLNELKNYIKFEDNKHCEVAPMNLGDIAEEDTSDGEYGNLINETEYAIPQNVEKIISDFEKDLEIDTADKFYDNFLNKDTGAQMRLADLFKDKITEKHTEICSQIDAESTGTVVVTPEVMEMCVIIRKQLASYRHGTFCKMFKIMIPNSRNWEELLYMTEPDKWTAAAMYQATRIFVSNLSNDMAQRYVNLVLLPRVRDDISHYHRVNYHIYEALCKAMFKPAAFLKGILLPLCMSGNCTNGEAIIIGSILSKKSIPMNHAAAAILKIAEMDYSSANSIFLRILFDKKYALPYRVIDSCVYHFIKFRHEKLELPVLWHQSLLAFVQRYKEHLSQDQKDAILEVIKFHGHYKMTPEVRRELQQSKCREQMDEL